MADETKMADTTTEFPPDILSSTRLDDAHGDDGIECDISDVTAVRSSTERSGWSPMVVLTAIVTTLGCTIPLGYHLAVINTPSKIINDFANVSYFNHYEVVLTESQLNVLWSSIVNILIVGALVGSLSGSWAADKFGRKGAVGVNIFLSLVAAILFITAFYAGSVEVLLFGRLLAGISVGLTTSTVPMYLTEIASTNTRGALGGLTSLGLTAGVVLGEVLGMNSVLGNEACWHFLLACYACPTVLAALLMPYVPESPKYLYIVISREQKAIDELSRLRGLSAEHLFDEMDQLDASAIANKKHGTTSIGHVLRSSSLRLPLLLVIALQAGQQLSGINAVFFYSMTIFKKAGISQDVSEYATLGIGGINLLVAGVALFVINQSGRRPLLLISCLLSAASLLLLTLSIVCIDSASWMQYVSITAVLSFIMSYTIGLGPISYFIGSELFAEGPRSVAMALGSVAMWSSNFIVGITFPTLYDVIGGYAFLPHATSTVLLCAFLYFYLPETRSRDPQEIVELLDCRKRQQYLVTRDAEELKGNNGTSESFSVAFSETGSAILRTTLTEED